MSVKPYIQGVLILTGAVWAMLALFAVMMLAWFDWMTWMGLFYTGLNIVMGAAFYWTDRRRYESAREHEGR